MISRFLNHRLIGRSELSCVKSHLPRLILPHLPRRQIIDVSQPRILTAKSGDGAMQQPPSQLQQTAMLDDMIDRLLAAKTEQQLATIIAENIVAVDTKFWIRIATRNDTASSAEDKEKLQVLASTVMKLVDALMKKSEKQLSDSGKVLQEILSAAADERGEWYLPLRPAQVKGMRVVIEENSERCDEALLSNAFAWIRKCNDDGLDTMVTLIQKVLQLYAAQQLKGPETQGAAGTVNEVVYAEESEWSSIIKEKVKSGDLSEPEFMQELQRKMERVVLGLESGSYAQRVQAEYLKEVEARAKECFGEIANE